MFTSVKNWIMDHKKITAAVIAAVLSLVPDKLIDADKKKLIVETIMVFIAGQGVADMGKEKAKIEAKASLKGG